MSTRSLTAWNFKLMCFVCLVSKFFATTIIDRLSFLEYIQTRSLWNKIMDRCWISLEFFLFFNLSYFICNDNVNRFCNFQVENKGRKSSNIELFPTPSNLGAIPSSAFSTSLFTKGDIPIDTFVENINWDDSLDDDYSDS